MQNPHVSLYERCGAHFPELPRWSRLGARKEIARTPVGSVYERCSIVFRSGRASLPFAMPGAFPLPIGPGRHPKRCRHLPLRQADPLAQAHQPVLTAPGSIFRMRSVFGIGLVPGL